MGKEEDTAKLGEPGTSALVPSKMRRQAPSQKRDPENSGEMVEKKTLPPQPTEKMTKTLLYLGVSPG